MSKTWSQPFSSLLVLLIISITLFTGVYCASGNDSAYDQQETARMYDRAFEKYDQDQQRDARMRLYDQYNPDGGEAWCCFIGIIILIAFYFVRNPKHKKFDRAGLDKRNAARMAAKERERAEIIAFKKEHGILKPDKKNNISEIYKDPCKKCGAIDFYYYSHWDELICNQCGRSISFAKIMRAISNNELVEKRANQEKEHGILKSDKKNNISGIYKDPCEECGTIDFDYDSQWDELICKQCGWSISFAVYSNSSKAMRAALNNELAEKEAEKTRKEKALFSEREEKALLLGFSIKDESKECPACAETIKLKAAICRFCKKDFSNADIHKAIRNRIEDYLADHKKS